MVDASASHIHLFNPREEAMCAGAARLFSANFTAYDSLSWLALITLSEGDVNYFLLRVRFNFKHRHTLTINILYWYFPAGQLFVLESPHGYPDINAASEIRAF